jgi:hypothetical protein
MKVGQANAFGMKAVEIWCLKHGVSVAAKVTVTLIVRDDDDHVGARVFGGECRRQ